MAFSWGSWDFIYLRSQTHMYVKNCDEGLEKAPPPPTPDGNIFLRTALALGQ